MATVIQRYINSASSGGDGTTNATSGGTAAYATFAAATADIFADYPDFVASDIQMDVDVTGLCTTNGTTVMEAIAQDATRFLRFRAASGQSTTKYDATKAGLTSASAQTLSGVRSYTRFDSLQIVNTSTSTSAGDGLNISGTSFVGLQFTNCVFHRRNRGGTATDGDAIMWSGVVQKGLLLANCVFSGTWFDLLDSNYTTAGSSFVFYNNTAVGLVGLGFKLNNAANNTVWLKNNRVEAAGLCYDLTGTYVSATNASSDTSSPNNTFDSKTGTYTNSGAFDYSLAAGDYGIDGGTDLSTDASSKYSFSTDIAGATRTGTWEIGAFNYVAATAALRRRAYVSGRPAVVTPAQDPTRSYVVMARTVVDGSVVIGPTPDVTNNNRRRLGAFVKRGGVGRLRRN